MTDTCSTIKKLPFIFRTLWTDYLDITALCTTNGIAEISTAFQGKNHKQDTGDSSKSSDRRSTLGWFQTSNGEIWRISSEGWSNGRAFQGFIMDWFVSRRLPDDIHGCLGWGWQKWEKLKDGVTGDGKLETGVTVRWEWLHTDTSSQEAIIVRVRRWICKRAFDLVLRFMNRTKSVANL